jgi:hypothetical protein
MTTVMVASPEASPPAEQHAPWCSGGCRRWLAYDQPSGLGYPCGCARTKSTAPDPTEAVCWWRDGKTNRLHCRCSCWGAERVDQAEDCCVWHPLNPRYVLNGPGTLDPEADPATDDPGAADGRKASRAEAYAAMFEDDGEPHRGPPPEDQAPIVHRWTPAELTCECPEPNDWPKTSKHVHCTDCHNSFNSPSTFRQHRRDWRFPCLDPRQVLDCWTGRQMMEVRGGLWGMVSGSSYKPAGWTPGKFHAT